MKVRLFIKISFIFLFIPFCLSGCFKPTFSKETLDKSVIDICKKEYNIDVKAKMIGSTFGVYLPLEGLVDKDAGLTENAREKIEHVSFAIQRVTTSADKPPLIYTLTVRDSLMPGTELNMTGFIYDILRVRLLDISRDEYFKRVLKNFRINPSIIGEEKVKLLFKDLNENSPSIQNIKYLFYPIYSIGVDSSQKIEIKSMFAKEISDQETLFYIITNEYYTIKDSFLAYESLFPPGFTNEYLILVDMTSPDNPIKEIASKYFMSNTEIKERSIKETFDRYADTGYIGLDGLPTKELGLDWFLATTIARRIKPLFEEDKDLKGKYQILKLGSASFSRTFYFKLAFTTPKDAPEGEKMVFNKILKMISSVMRGYDFRDFDNIEIDNLTTGFRILISKDDLEKFRLNKLNMDEIIKNKGSKINVLPLAS